MLKRLKWRGCELLVGGGVNGALLVRISGWVLAVKFVNTSLVASCRSQGSVNSATVVIRGVILAT